MSEPAAARTLKLTLAYDGTPFVGWQRQAEGVSIQGLLEEALARFEGGSVTVAGAGRTDAGVHALAQVASVRLSSAIDTGTLRRALNAVLPAEVRVMKVEEAPDSFHARYAARGKTYRYWIARGEFVGPFRWRYTWHVPGPLDVAAMVEASACLIGRHDFAAFQASGSSVSGTERTLAAVSVALGRDRGPLPESAWMPGVGPEEDSESLVCEFSGDGFLRHMVRTIVGTLVEIGRDREEGTTIATILSSRSRDLAGPTAPASGLFLVRVDY